MLDEIDKADADLPNSLLETLDNARFRIPWVNQSIGYQTDNPSCIRPLVVITTNEDRQLPAAFVRRCLVLNLELPDNEAALVDFLVNAASSILPMKMTSLYFLPRFYKKPQPSFTGTGLKPMNWA